MDCRIKGVDSVNHLLQLATQIANGLEDLIVVIVDRTVVVVIITN